MFLAWTQDEWMTFILIIVIAAAILCVICMSGPEFGDPYPADTTKKNEPDDQRPQP